MEVSRIRVHPTMKFTLAAFRSFLFWRQRSLAKKFGIDYPSKLRIISRGLCNQIVCIPGGTHYATLPFLQTGNNDIRKLWMRESPR